MTGPPKPLPMSCHKAHLLLPGSTPDAHGSRREAVAPGSRAHRSSDSNIGKEPGSPGAGGS